MGKGGGVATFVRKWNKVQCGSVRERMQSMPQIKCRYIEYGDGEVQGKVVWCRDFNAHGTLWGSDRTEVNGLIVEEFIEDKGLVCVNDRRGTRYDCVQNKESVTDLTMTSNERKRIWILHSVCMS